jgi:ribonuclease Z
MPPAFYPVLVNLPTGDPGLFIPLLFQRRAVMMDLGDIADLSSKNILKISHVFITHTHMDHFIGFDRLLRVFLGREKEVVLYGPEGFLANLEGKLKGYTWNLLDNYASCLTLTAVEVGKDTLTRRQYLSREKFSPGPINIIGRHQQTPLHEEPAFSVFGALLDHGIPVLGFSLKEKFTINIRKDAMDRLGLCPGPWLQDFKKALYDGADPECAVRAPREKSESASKWRLGDLAEELAMITKGQKIAYICDVGYSRSNREKIIDLVRGADHLFIEAAFLENEHRHALQKHHLTARQAGEIAASAGVRRYTLFHFSPRYEGASEKFYKEAAEGLSLV